MIDSSIVILALVFNLIFFSQEVITYLSNDIALGWSGGLIASAIVTRVFIGGVH